MDHQLLVQLLWQGQLAQDAVHIPVLIQLPDQPQKLLLTGPGIQAVGKADDAALCTVCLLSPHIHLGSRI